MKLPLIFIFLFFFQGCSTISSERAAEEAFEKSAKEVFDSENAIPKERIYANLDAYHQHYESILRDVECSQNEARIKPALKRIQAKYSDNREGFLTYIECFIYKNGCSRALLGALVKYDDNGFSFPYNLYLKFPNPEYAYSQTLIEEMKYYGSNNGSQPQ